MNSVIVKLDRKILYLNLNNYNALKQKVYKHDKMFYTIKSRIIDIANTSLPAKTQ